MKKSLKDYINFRKKYIELERQEEKNFHITQIYNLGPKREKKQQAILNLKWKIIKNLDDIALIRFWKKENFITQIKEQDIVVFLPNFFYKFKDLWLKEFSKKLEVMPLWTVDYIWKQFIDIWVNKPFPAWLTKSNVDVHLFVNDITFKRQLEALDLLPKLKIEDKLLIEDYDWNINWEVILKNKRKIKNLDKIPKIANFTQNLNEYQQDFVKKSLAFNNYLLLHWPFWTWKTTTLIETIIQNYKNKKLLVTADSNTAVDNILTRLIKFNFKEWEIVRIWPYTRLLEKVSNCPVSIYDLMEKHPLNKQLRKLDIQLDKLRKQQSGYKKPTPSLKRWMTDDQIHYYANLRKSYRWVKQKIIVSMSNWLKIQEEISEIMNEKNLIKQKIEDDIIENAKIVLSTNSMCFSNFLKEKKFDIAIIDEWTQATEPSCLLPIILAEKFIIAWDHKQLPPTVLSQQAKPLEKSLFERFIDYFWDNQEVYSLLQIQYRMNEKLMQFPNKMFYNWKLKAANHIKNISLIDLVWNKTWKYIDSKQVLYWIDTKWEQKTDENNSIYNLEEVEKVKTIVNELLEFGLKKEQIWVISPYSAQVLKLKDHLDVEVNTIDWFQWQEKEVIIISWARTKNIWFLMDKRRLNVAITRAKRLLINIWDSNNLKQEKIFEEFISYVKNVGVFIKS